MDRPLERHLKIGKATVGLLGLDIVMSRLLADSAIDRHTAVNQLYSSIQKQNYIPPGKEEMYKEALAQEYERLLKGQERHDTTLTIRILGPGCVSCNNLQVMVIEIMNEMGVAADVFQIHDLDEIGRFGGGIQTPALIINDQLKSSGRLPTRSQVEEWIRDVAEER